MNMLKGLLKGILPLSFGLLGTACAPQGTAGITTWPAEFAPGVTYTNVRIRTAPWSVHVVRVDRTDPTLHILSSHARGGVGRISTLSEQIEALSPKRGEPLAGVNGDFYARDRSAYAGDPRGLQIVDGDLISAPIGGVAFWVDPSGGFHSTNVASQFRITWPDGTKTSFGLNQARRGSIVLYTPSMGASTYARGGVELVLEHGGKGPWLPLQVGEQFTARVREVRNGTATPLAKDIMVLSLDPTTGPTVPEVAAGALLEISTATLPDLRGVKDAISGGPLLVNGGQVQRVKAPLSSGAFSYEYRSMTERHPRSAVGWNARHFFLIQVDGRQRGLSVGMDLQELGEFAAKQLGCTHAMNLDGGVSSVLWADGEIRNSPCAGSEKGIANALIVARRRTAAPLGQGSGGTGQSVTPPGK